MEIHKNLMLIPHNSSLVFNIEKPKWELKDFRAILGHKVNHAFEGHGASSLFSYAYHARFGYTITVLSTTKISKNQQVYVDYKYPDSEESDDVTVPKWYAAEYEKVSGKKWIGSVF